MKLAWTQDEKTMIGLPDKHYGEHQVKTAMPRREWVRATQEYLEKRSGESNNADASFRCSWRKMEATALDRMSGPRDHCTEYSRYNSNNRFSTTNRAHRHSSLK